MAEPESRVVLIPPDDGELFHTLIGLEEVLVQLRPPCHDEEGALHDCWVGLEALQRMLKRLSTEARSPSADLFRASDRFEYGSLRQVTLSVEDLNLVGVAIAALDSSLAAGAEDVYFALEAFARPPQHTSAKMVVEFAQAQAILTLEPDDDVRLLSKLIMASPNGYVALSGAEDQAYRRYISRVLHIQLDDPLQRLALLGLRPEGT